MQIRRLLETDTLSALGKALDRAFEIVALTVDAIRLLAEHGQEQTATSSKQVAPVIDCKTPSVAGNHQ